jgi:hypothetical protein
LQDYAQKVVDDLSGTLIPANDLLFMANTTYDLVRKDLDRKIESGTLDRNLGMVLQLASQNSLAELVRYSIGRDPAKTQAENARGHAMRSLVAVSDLFGPQMLSSIQDQSVPEAQAKACIRATLIPSAPKLNDKDITQACQGKTWKTVLKGGNLELKFDELIRLPAPQRACSIYDFYRKSRLLEQKSGQ